MIRTLQKMALSLVISLICQGIYAADGSAGRMTFNIEPQPLRQALASLAEQTGLQILQREEDSSADGITAPRVVGKLSPREALDKLLANSGLKYEFLNDRTVRITSAQAADRVDVRTAVDSSMRLVQAQQTLTNASEASASPPKGGDKKEGSIQEVVVTAQKREERLQDVPQSVTVLSADTLAKLGATQFRDFANTVPGLSFFTAGAGRTQINLRGVTAGIDINSTVALYVDDVPYGPSSAFVQTGQSALDVALFDLDRIEVLRGPQGTLYGAASMGGLIKYVTKRPDTERFTLDTHAGISTTRSGGVSFNTAAALNAPLVNDKVALRVNGFESRDGGFVDNVSLGKKDVNDSDTYGGRVDLLLTPNDSLNVRLTAFLQNINRDGNSYVDFTTAGVPIVGELSQRRLFEEPFDQRYRLYSGTVSYGFGPATLTSISSYQTSRTTVATDVQSVIPALARPPFNLTLGAAGTVQDLSTDKFTQEVRLASKDDQTIEWLVGAVYTHETSKNANVLETRDLQGQPSAADLRTLIIPSRYKDIAGFGDVTFHATEKFDVTGGVRYAHNEQSVSQTNIGPLTGGPSRPEREQSDNITTYLANARYHFTERAIGYVRYATGYRPGGPNIVLNDTTTGLPLAAPTFEADKLKSYEAGFKADTAERNFGVDIAIYYTDWSNVQISAIRNGVGIRTNAPGGATVRGLELALTAHPLSSLLMTGAFAYTDAHLSDAAPDLGGRDRERLPSVPRLSGSINADYSIPVGDMRPTIGATVRYVSERRASFDNGLVAGLPQYILPSYTSVDLRAGITIRSVDLQLYGRNLFDRGGQFAEIPTVAFGGIVSQVSMQQPRTIGIGVTAHFWLPRGARADH